MVSVHRHVAVLRSLLEPGEQERLWIRASTTEPDHRGALLLTDRRLLWDGLGVLVHSQDSAPLSTVSGLRVEILPRGATLHLRVLGDANAFTGTAADIGRMMQAVQRERPDAVQTRDARPASIVDRLERLERLRDDGSLTGDEFAAAKRRLLG